MNTHTLLSKNGGSKSAAKRFENPSKLGRSLAVAATQRKRSLEEEDLLQDKFGKDNYTVQRKFAGTYGQLLNLITPESLGLESTDIYGLLHSLLRSESTEIKVEELDKEIGRNSYNHKTKTLHFKGTYFKLLMEEAKKPPESRDKALITDLISTISHEMSHAYDDIGRKKKMSDNTSNDKNLTAIFDTELLAWATEAIAARQTARVRPNASEAANKLIDSWQNWNPEMYSSIWQNKKKENVIAERLWTYFNMNNKDSTIDPRDIDQVQGWFNKNPQILELANRAHGYFLNQTGQTPPTHV